MKINIKSLSFRAYVCIIFLLGFFFILSFLDFFFKVQIGSLKKTLLFYLYLVSYLLIYLFALCFVVGVVVVVPKKILISNTIKNIILLFFIINRSFNYYLLI